MTIRVVQGLIDPARFGRASTPTDRSKAVSQAPASTVLGQQLQSVQASVTTAARAVASLSTEAVAIQLRASNRTGQEGEKLRDPSKAGEAADRVSEEIRARGDAESADPHAGLTSSTAREHFTG